MRTTIKFSLILAFILPLMATGQEMTAEERKVEIFTYEEKANLQNWFHEEVKRMEFNEEEDAQYRSVLVYYLAKISRLDDKDQDFTKAQFEKELNKLLKKQDRDLLEILSPEQFAIHQEIYGEFLRSAYKRWGINN